MSLVLKITSFHRLSPDQETWKSLDSGQLTIGRGTENDWTFADPQKLVSKRHCVVTGANGHYELTDVSTNGVFVNGSPEPVGQEHTVLLNAGDRLQIGEYDLEVQLDCDTEQTWASGTPQAKPESFPVTPTMIGDFADSIPSAPPLFPPSSEGGVEHEQFTHIAEPQRGVETSTMPDHATPTGDPMTLPTADTAPQVDPFPAEVRLPEGASPPDQEGVHADWDKDWTTPAPEDHTPQTTGADLQEAFEAFLAGAGINPADLPPSISATPQAFESFGRIYRDMIVGMMELLAARRSIKNEFRLSQTTIRPRENNPLKFSVGADETMVALLTPQGTGYMPSHAAFREAFDDIKAHQLAMMSGMQAAFQKMLRRLSPEALQNRVDRDRSLATILVSRRAQYWDAYLQKYETLVEEAAEDLEDLFGREFAKAYEAQVDRMRDFDPSE